MNLNFKFQVDISSNFDQMHILFYGLTLQRVQQKAVKSIVIKTINHVGDRNLFQCPQSKKAPPSGGCSGWNEKKHCSKNHHQRRRQIHSSLYANQVGTT